MNNIETWHIWKVVLYTYIFGERVYYFINGAWDSVITLMKKLKTKSLLHTIQNNSKKNKDHYVKCKTFKLWPSLWPLDTGGFFFLKKKHQDVVGTWPQPRHVTGNWIGDPLVHRMAFNPLSHISQGQGNFLNT